MQWNRAKLSCVRTAFFPHGIKKNKIDGNEKIQPCQIGASQHGELASPHLVNSSDQGDKLKPHTTIHLQWHPDPAFPSLQFGFAP